MESCQWSINSKSSKSQKITFNSRKDANFRRDNSFFLAKGKIQIHLRLQFWLLSEWQLNQIYNFIQGKVDNFTVSK